MHLLLLNQPYISGRNQTWNFKNCSVWNDCIYMYDQEGIVFLFLIPSLMVFLSLCLDTCVFISGRTGSSLPRAGASLGATSRGCLAALALRLLAAVASAAEHRL